MLMHLVCLYGCFFTLLHICNYSKNGQWRVPACGINSLYQICTCHLITYNRVVEFIDHPANITVWMVGGLILSFFLLHMFVITHTMGITLFLPSLFGSMSVSDHNPIERILQWKQSFRHRCVRHCIDHMLCHCCKNTTSSVNNTACSGQKRIWS